MQKFKIKSNRIGHFIVVLVVLLLIAVVIWALLIKEDPSNINFTGIIILTIVTVIGSVVLFMALKMIIQNPAVITIDDKGFEYNPGGVSSGFVPWSNVGEIKLVNMRTVHGNLNGVVWETALAVKLKDPALYTKQFNPFIKGLMGLNKNMYDADIFFRLSSFGKQAEAVHQLMLRNWNGGNGHK